MTSRRLILGFMLLLHAAFSLLGNAGTHALLGCQHDHCAAESSASSKATPHQHRGCRHAHCHTHSVPATPDSDSPSVPPHSDDRCAICQYFTRPLEATARFEWTLLNADLVATSAEVAFQPGLAVETVYEVRGPPVWL